MALLLRNHWHGQTEIANTLIDFDQIGTKEVIVNQKANPYGVVAFVSVFVNVLVLLSLASEHIENTGIVGGISGGLIVGFSIWGRQLFKYSKQKIIHGAYSIPFYYRKKEREKVDRFISILQSRKVSFLRDKFMKVDRYTPTDQLKSRFIWLKENDYINDNELEMLMEQIEHRKLIGGE